MSVIDKISENEETIAKLGEELTALLQQSEDGKDYLTSMQNLQQSTMMSDAVAAILDENVDNRYQEDMMNVMMRFALEDPINGYQKTLGFIQKILDDTRFESLHSYYQKIYQHIEVIENSEEQKHIAQLLKQLKNDLPEFNRITADIQALLQ